MLQRYLAGQTAPRERDRKSMDLVVAFPRGFTMMDILIFMDFYDCDSYFLLDLSHLSMDFHLTWPEGYIL
jgi:hypothetical protein